MIQLLNLVGNSLFKLMVLRVTQLETLLLIALRLDLCSI